MTTDNVELEETTIAAVEAAAGEPVRRRSAVRRLWRAEAIYVVALMAFGVLAVFAYFNAFFGWDLRVARELQSLTAPGLFELMRAVSVFGNKWIPWALTTTVTVAFFLLGRRSESAGLLVSAGGGAVVNFMFKLLIGRPRPTAELVTVYRSLRTESFPSGHVTFYVCFFGFLFFTAFALLPRGSMARRITLALMALPVLLVGLSRVYLGAHWPSDTLGAYLLSGVWLALSLHLYRGWKERATFHPELKKEAQESPPGEI